MTVKDLLSTEVGEGEVAFVVFNEYSGVALKTAGTVIVVDPAFVDPDVFEEVDAILITHEHFDHLDPDVVEAVQRRTGCLVVSDRESYRRLRAAVPENRLVAVDVGDEVDLEGVEVYVEESNHPPATRPVTYVIEGEGGVKVYHTSDSLPFRRMEEIGRRFTPDVAFCTVGIAPGASLTTGVEVAELVRPRLAVPYHGRGFERFCRLLSSRAPDVECLATEVGRVYKYPR